MKRISTSVHIFVLLTSLTAFAGEIAGIPIMDIANSPMVEEPLDIVEDMIAYDGEPAGYYPDYNLAGTFFAVRFTPAQSCTLSYIQVTTLEAPGNALIHIYSDDNGIPGADLITPFSHMLSGDLSRQQINLPEPIDIGASDFHVAVEYSQVAPPHVTLDNDGGTGRSEYKLPGGDWNTFPDNDINIRAFVNYYGNDLVPPTILSPERILGFSYEGDHPITATITDDSGIWSATLFYSADGIDYYSVAMNNTSGDTYDGNIPAQPVGSSVRYYIQAIDDSPNRNEGLLPPEGPSAPFVMEIVDGMEYAYDDAAPEAWYVVDNEWDNNKFAVKFTPEDYPIMVTGARAMVSDSDPFDFTINADIDDHPGDIIAGPFESYEGRASWAITFFEEGQQPEISFGSFWLVFNWRESTPGSPSVGTDDSDPDSMSMWYNDASGWNTFSGGDFIMRVIVASPTGIEEISPDESLPARFRLLGNHPNPFNPSTEISFIAPREGYVKLEVYNIVGQRVKTLFDGNVTSGLKTAAWDGSNDNGIPVSSGIYYYRLTTVDGIDVRKMTLLK